MLLNPRTANQRTFINMLYSNTPIVIGHGPAGTGKTLMAAYIGAHRLARGEFQKIVMTRPTVSVDEQLGFLPGSMQKKMDPWVTPIFDAFKKYYSPKQIKNLVENGAIEICPLGFMRGRTFDKTYFICDEMQNSTPSQMQMAITRIGEDTKIIITGDPRQHDRGFENNGLVDLVDRCTHEDYIEHVKFIDTDVQRNKYIQRVLEMYAK